MSHSILFTGHMIDDKERVEPRFTPDKEIPVKAEILKQLLKEKAVTKRVITGIAGGACGGDILFHELCEEINISTEMYLALPIENFKEKSVSFAGSVWEIRFDRLVKKLPVHILSKERRVSTEYNIWIQTNLWMLDSALKVERGNMTLIALWDGKGGDGVGGTKHMINIAREKGAKINIIDINKI